jgi:hypothetical protein
LHDVDLGIMPLNCAASVLGVTQQRICDGWHRLASASCGRRAAILSQVTTLLQSPAWRPLQEFLPGVQHLLTPKWCMTGGVTVVGGEVPDPVERKDLIA